MQQRKNRADLPEPIRLKRQPSWLLRLFRLSDMITIAIEPSGLSLLSDDDVPRIICSRVLSPKYTPTKGMFFSSLTIPTESGDQKIRGLPHRLARDAHDAMRRWWYTELEPEARRIAARAHESVYGGYLRTSQWQRDVAAARALLARCYHVPEDTLLPRESVKAFEDLSRVAGDDTSILQGIRDRYLRTKLTEHEAFFDSIESNPLTHRQRLACITDEDNNLVLAGAGTGKTSVMIGRAGYLIKDGQALPDQILMLAFGKDAARELRDRASTNLGTEEICIQTFHKLGQDIIAAVEGRRPSVSPYATDKRKLGQAVEGWLTEEMREASYRDLVIQYFAKHLHSAPNEWDFETEGDYFQYLESNNIRTFQGELVKSYGELLIANYLYRMGIEYRYEQKYEIDTRTPDFRQYAPDFYLVESGIYLEYWGTDREDNVAPYINQEAYLKSRQWKRDLHASCGTTLVEAYHYERIDGTLLHSLEQRLVEAGVRFRPLSPDAILQYLRDAGTVSEFALLMTDILRRVRATGKTTEELCEEAASAPDPDQLRAAVRLLTPLLQRYHDTLKAAGDIDFDEMIARATHYVHTGVFKPIWKWLLIDECQDLSAPRARLVQALLQSSNGASLFCVGDDYQSIYRFSGSDISFTTRFSDHFGPTVTTTLDKTFRMNDTLNDLTLRFIMANPNQARKTIMSHTSRAEPAVSLLMTDNLRTDNHEALLRTALGELSKTQATEASVLLLARFRHDLPDNGLMETLNRNYPHLNVTANSIHAAKGQEADYVVLLNVTRGPFGTPSEKVTHPLLDAMLPQSDKYPHAEERRVFYVALTRARQEVIVVTDMSKPSTFIEELIDGKYLIDAKRFPATMGQLYASDTRCPQCKTGSLVARNGPHGGFYGCSFFPRCDYKENGCPNCGLGMTRSGTYRKCIDPGCTGWRAICPRCGGELQGRENHNGVFWKCSNWASQPPCCKYKANDILPPD